MERNGTLSARLWPALDGLLSAAQKSSLSDVLGLQTFDALRKGLEPSKVNVGVATREMVFNAFKEFIRGAGDTAMDECWRIGASKD